MAPGHGDGYRWVRPALPMTSNTMPPAWAVRLELARALLGVAVAPFRTLVYLATRGRLRAELRQDMCAPAAIPTAPELDHLPDRPLRIFIACAEASGEIHAAGVVLAIRAECQRLGAPLPEIRGLGGTRLAALDVDCLADPVAKAAMGFEGVLSAIPYYLDLLRQVATCFRHWQPDVFLPVDSPALHVPMAHIARRYQVRSVHFVTPQYWGWAPWRVHGYARAIDRALTILPFENRWFARHGVAQAHVGHPLLDALKDVPTAAQQKSIAGQQESTATQQEPNASGGTVEESQQTLVLLAGSRRGIIDRNLPWMLRAAQGLRQHLIATGTCPGKGDLPAIRILQEEDEHSELIRQHIAAADIPAELAVGDLHGELRRARAALTVSGTILIDLLHHRLPAVVVYRIRKKREQWMYNHLLTTPYFASVNLLAGEEVLPEFCFRGEGPEEIGHALARCYGDPEWRATCRAGMERAAARLGPPGACERAARHALAVASAAPIGDSVQS